MKWNEIWNGVMSMPKRWDKLIMHPPNHISTYCSRIGQRKLDSDYNLWYFLFGWNVNIDVVALSITHDPIEKLGNRNTKMSVSVRDRSAQSHWKWSCSHPSNSIHQICDWPGHSVSCKSTKAKVQSNKKKLVCGYLAGARTFRNESFKQFCVVFHDRETRRWSNYFWCFGCVTMMMDNVCARASERGVRRK